MSTPTTPTIEEVLARLQALETENQKLKIAAATGASKPEAKTIIKFNKSNGVFIRDERFQMYSDKKQKSYTGGINFSAHELEAVKVLLTDKDLIAKVLEVMQTGVEYRA